MDGFEAIGDPVRRSLLDQLARGPARVADLAAGHTISRPAISRHLRVLSEAGLVAASERGRERHYRLIRSGLEPLTQWLAQLAPRPRLSETDFNGLDLEVRRVGAERAGRRRSTSDQHRHEETA